MRTANLTAQAEAQALDSRRSPHWSALEDLAKKSWSLPKLFEQDDRRGERFQASSLSLYLDYSKQCLDDEVVKHLLALADDSKLKDKIRWVDIFSQKIFRVRQNIFGLPLGVFLDK